MSERNERGERPDPDALLRRVQEEEARAHQGKLKVFFGFAPGVGKTYRMLQVARDLVIDQRVEVVVGLVETHRRPETAAMVLGLELLPRRQVTYRGRVLEELDLDAALSRRPKVLLVDELAHTNAPGSRHAKRWQDVLELLDAGIDVLTTVNVQHVESLNDVVAQITGVRVRETIPDKILDRADGIEVVDIAPEELLQRLAEGKVYLPDQAQRAADHFFQRGNLLALRELALRRTAQHVDEDVQAYRERHGVSVTWPAGERLLVCVGPAPSSGRLIRAAARMAAGLRCPWVAAYVEAAPLGRQGDEDRARLEAHLRLAESLGGAVTRLSAGRVSESLLGYARRNNVTRLIIGKPTHSRVRDRLRGSLLDEVVRGSGDIDVHVISGDAGGAREGGKPRGAGAPIAFAPYGWALAAVAVATAVATAIRSVLAVPELDGLYLVAVIVVAMRLGRGPSILTAALGVAAYDFFFVAPRFTFAVADGRYFLTFAMMFGVGFVVSELTTRLRRQEQDALAREERTAALYALSRDLGRVEVPSDVAAAVVRHAAEVFEAAVFVLRADDAGALQQLGAAPRGAILEAKEMGVARWCHDHGRMAGLGTDTLPGSRAMCMPLGIGASRLGVLALAPKAKAPLRVEQRALLEVFCRQAAFAFERARLAEEARASALRAKTEEMRSSLLSAVSHDLRTPLAGITGAATALRDDGNLGEGTRRELLESVCDEAERLERLLANLLDMTRLEAGGLSLKRDWVPLEEVIGSALTRLEARLGERQVEISIPAELPLMWVDPVLFGQIFVNLFENAAKYTPPESPIVVKVREEGGVVSVEVMDRGPGLPRGAEQRVFEKFFRGAHVGVSGVGLGLPICRGIAEAHGGTMQAEQREGGGAMFRVTVPLGGEAPQMPPEPPEPPEARKSEGGA
ncbi:sensor histidine kinase [Chondromyces apiculatus]|nr:sensor histidine kinase KdpD [Chondromyces apiculatus]